MNARRRRWLKLGPLLGASALLWSCVAPILTVPPPNAVAFATTTITDSTGAAQTRWIASGGALEQAANAQYVVIDQTLGGQGVVATARNDGSFTTQPMVGNRNDHVLVYYKTPFGDYSDSLCVLLSDASPPPACPE